MKSFLFYRALMLILLAGLVPGCRGAVNPEIPGERVVENLSYGAGEHPDKLQQLDLRLPAKPVKAPVLVMIHGGGWCIGQRDNGNNGAESEKAKFFTAQGFIYATVSYRLSPAVKHPAHVQDVAAALQYIHTHIAEYGGDPERIYVMGHSAGAHLAALVAIDQRYLEAEKLSPQCLKGVILLDGAGYDIPRQYDKLPTIGLLFRYYNNAFTSDVDRQKDASPVLQVKSGGYVPPFLLLYVSSRDDAVEQNKLLTEALRQGGYQAEPVAVKGKTHATINRDLGDPDDPVTMRILKFLGK